MMKLRMFFRKLFLNRNVFIQRANGSWEAYNDWYGTGASNAVSKEEAFKLLKECIEAKKKYWREVG